MNITIERQFIERLGEKLEGFERKRSDLWIFRCPVCGDSKKDPAKRRGFFYRRFGKTRFKCHNCGVSESLAEFIKRIDNALYLEYIERVNPQTSITETTNG